MQTYYDTLHVTPSANQKLIERAYRTLSQEYHPDHNPEIDRAKYTQLQTELNKAYEVLRDPEKRKAYDEMLDLNLLSNAVVVSNSNDEKIIEYKEHRSGNESKDQNSLWEIAQTVTSYLFIIFLAYKFFERVVF